MPCFHRNMWSNRITIINDGAFNGLTALTELYDPRLRWHVPNLVLVASVSPSTLPPSPSQRYSLYLLPIPLFMYIHDHTLYVPNYSL